jgi:hypothetical protein
MKQLLCALLLLFFSLPVFSQQQVTLSGSVTNGATGTALDFGTVVLFEAQVREYINEDGTYSISAPAGTYTLQITSDGLETYTETVTLTSNTVKNISLSPLRIEGEGITVTGERKQKLSRRTLDVEELEEVPASFGDSVSALTSLPGVIRASGSSNFFGGPLVIRGYFPNGNRYYVDGVPIQYPQHFGGLHSVVANEMMSSVDLYSSAYPAKFRGDLGAVIEINTVDDVETLSSVFDLSLISATGIVQVPTYKTDTSLGTPQKKLNGYFIASGRYGYLSLIVPAFYKLTTGDELESVPNYWDYQIKYKNYLDEHNSITFLAIGAKDWFDIRFPDSIAEEETVDPLLQDLEFDTDQMFHNQALYYTYQQGKISNSIIGYATLPYYFNYISFNHPQVVSELKDLEVTSMPFEFTVKDALSYEWWRNRGELNLSAEYNHYRFITDGDEVVLNEIPTDDNVDIFTTEGLLRKEKVKRTYSNHALSGHADNRFTFGGFTLIPQVRAEYLHRTGVTEVDPRGLISYEFETGTTLSAASGKYHAFDQINPYNFQILPGRASAGKEIGPERAIHNSLGVEQALSLYTISLEGFYNYYYDLLVDAPHYENNRYVWGKNIGTMRNYGAELLLQKDRRAGTNDFFGWSSYTFTQSQYKSGLSKSEDSSGNGDKWLTGDFEQIHSTKTVLGYVLGPHTFTAKFSFYTQLPFTPINGSWEDESYYEYTTAQGDPQRRYLPIESTKINSQRFPPTHQLDLRYSFTNNPEWGQVKYYVEILNFTGFWYNPYVDYEWNYTKPYSSNNPKKVRNDGLRVVPNLGAEIRF